MKSEVSDNKIIFKAPTAGVYKFDNGKVNLTAKAADGCPECFNLALELLKEKEAYEKLKAQLKKCEAALKEYADPETWKNVGEYGVDTWILRDDQGNLAREYFKEKGQV